MKKADEKLKGVCTPAKKEDAEKVIGVIKAEEDQATSGFGGIFGE